MEIIKEAFCKKILWSIIIIAVSLIISINGYGQSNIINIERAPFYNGYTETTTYDNGNQIIVNYLPCSNCGTSKICPFCNGNGVWVTPGYGQVLPCYPCGQTGVCKACNDNGYYVSTSFIKYANGQIYSGNQGSFLDGSSSRNKRSSGSNNSKSCTYCNGTGIDPTPCDGGRASWAGYYNSKGTKCPHCGRYDGHMHNRCASCNIPR